MSVEILDDFLIKCIMCSLHVCALLLAYVSFYHYTAGRKGESFDLNFKILTEIYHLCDILTCIVESSHFIQK